MDETEVFLEIPTEFGTYGVLLDVTYDVVWKPPLNGEIDLDFSVVIESFRIKKVVDADLNEPVKESGIKDWLLSEKRDVILRQLEEYLEDLI